MTITDETLASYMDGELTAEEAGEVEAALAATPALMRDMLAMLRADKAASAYFHAIDDRPLPAGIVTALEQFSEIKTPDNVVPLEDIPAPAFIPRRAAWHLPLAAGIALVIGLGTGLNLAPAPVDGASSNLIAANQPLYDVLEQGISGQTVALEGATARYATPLMTVTADGAFCREFEVADARTITRGAACRQGDTSWLITVQTAQATENSDGTYQTASETRPAAVAAFFATAAPLDDAQEQILIANKWIQ